MFRNLYNRTKFQAPERPAEPAAASLMRLPNETLLQVCDHLMKLLKNPTYGQILLFSGLFSHLMELSVA